MLAATEYTKANTRIQAAYVGESITLECLTITTQYWEFPLEKKPEQRRRKYGKTLYLDNLTESDTATYACYGYAEFSTIMVTNLQLFVGGK